jgi:hypothetical protein
MKQTNADMGKTKSNSFQSFNPIAGVKGFGIAKKAPAPAPVASHQKYSVSHVRNHHWGVHNAPVQLAKLPPFMR